MIDQIIDIARDTIDLENTELQALVKALKEEDHGLQDFQRDLVQALLASEECRSIVKILLHTTDKTEIEQTVHTFCKNNDQYIPPIFLLGRALLFRIGGTAHR